MLLPTIVTRADLLTIVPEIFVCASAFALLMVDLFIAPQRRALTHFLALLVLLAAAVLTARDMGTGATMAFGNFFIRDVASDVLKMAMYVVTGLVFIYSKPYLQDRDLFKGEFYALILFALVGIYSMQAQSLQIVQSAHDSGAASQVLQQRLEQLRLNSFDTLAKATSLTALMTGTAGGIVSCTRRRPNA